MLLIAIFFFGLIQPRAAVQAPATGLVLEGRRPTGYTSLCELQPRFKAALSLGAGTGWTLAHGCSDFDAKKLVPLLVTFKNPDPSTRTEFTIPRLPDITQRYAGATEPAAALYMPWASPRGFATDVRGEIVVILAPGADVELLYLLPPAKGPVSVSVRGHGVLRMVK
ncbi:MAG: hypothetical protein WD690_00885 [Vicinamibacterales bacterium]